MAKRVTGRWIERKAETKDIKARSGMEKGVKQEER